LLNLEPRLVPVSYASKLHKAGSYLADRIGLRPSLADLPSEIPWHPACVVGTGSTTYYAVKQLAARLEAPSVAILYPRGYRLDFDLILAPAMDEASAAPNLIELPINLCDQRPEVFAPQLAEFAKRHQKVRPAVGMIVGGDSKSCTLPDATVLDAAAKIRERFPEHEHWLTTSRRTTPALESQLAEMGFDYACLYNRDPFNPVPAFIDACEHLFVTSDSASMVSECVSRGSATVEVILADHNRPDDKFLRHVQALQKRSCVQYFGDQPEANRKVDLAACLADVPKRLKF
jgi:mitochondrial fission protein ELM1